MKIPSWLPEFDPQQIFDLCKFGQLHINKNINNAKLHKFQWIDQRKSQTVHQPQNLDSPKNKQALGNLLY